MIPKSKPDQRGCCVLPQLAPSLAEAHLWGLRFDLCCFYGSKDTFVFLVSASCLICDSTNVSASLITSRLNFPN